MKKTQTLYLRHAPRPLMRRVRMEASRRGTTMECITLRAMQRGLQMMEKESVRA